MQLLQTVLALIVTLGILVTVHEFGHFWVARRCGVKVLRFSVGFGKPFFMWRDRQGTEFAIAAIPLGGYVRMLDSREAPVSEAERAQTFDAQTPGRRIAIAAAGPMANFLFALLAYWLLNVIGYTVVAPRVGPVVEGTPASQMGLESGMEILAIDGRTTASWRDVGMRLIELAGHEGPVSLQVRDDHGERVLSTELERWMVGVDEPDPLHLFGIEPWRPAVPAVLGTVVAGGRAHEAGLQAGDRILAVDDRPVTEWRDLVTLIREAAEKPLWFSIQRGDAQLRVSVTPAGRDEDGILVGHLGVAVLAPDWPADMLRTQRLDPLSAVPAAMAQVWADTRLTLVAIHKMLTGLLSVKNLSGPITIAQVAESSVSSGFEDFIRFLAYLSISLGVLNLLPVPVLDGGHILFYSLEALRGRPLSERAQAFGIRLGMAMILSLMVIALYNDLMRL